ncbi:hypothetical protein DFH09DRAFT_1089222 [Mycena vulgaris]|nr:hypothetical protein DFH09DRAFT_1089222 [Mycena vulgaris]
MGRQSRDGDSENRPGTGGDDGGATAASGALVAALRKALACFDPLTNTLRRRQLALTLEEAREVRNHVLTGSLHVGVLDQRGRGRRRPGPAHLFETDLRRKNNRKAGKGEKNREKDQLGNAYRVAELYISEPSPDSTAHAKQSWIKSKTLLTDDNPEKGLISERAKCQDALDFPTLSETGKTVLFRKSTVLVFFLVEILPDFVRIPASGLPTYYHRSFAAPVSGGFWWFCCAA